MQTQLKVVEALPQRGRKWRNPEHRWNLRQKPYVIQPMCIAPVLPGETLKNILFQARAVVDPIKNPLIGWWAEYYWFYVKLRDLPEADATALVNLMITPGSTLAARHTAAKVDTYHVGDSIDFTQLALESIVNRYFRDEDENWDTAGSTLGSMPLAKMEHPGWMDSLIDTTALPDGGTIAGGSTAEDTTELLNTYEYLRGMKFIDMTFEDYCRSYGVNIPTKEELNKPELLRHVREWSYPVNHVEPTTGVPSSAVSWAVRERVDKDRFFKEPGFVVGLTCFRPKVYFSGQTSALVNWMDTAFSWLPAIMSESPETSLKEFAGVTATDGPLGSTPTNGYWVDMRDLLLYGDQFINFSLASTDAGLVANPTAGLNKRYISSADIDALFTNAAGGFNLVRQDGVAKLSILGRQVDMT